MYIVDTCIINWLVEGKIHLSDLPVDGRFVATHVQIDELKKTGDSKLRAELLAKFDELDFTIIPTVSFALDTSRMDQANVSGTKRKEAIQMTL